MITPSYLKKLLLLCLLVLMGSVQTVFAHAIPVTSTPLPNAILETSPSEITILFSEPTVPNLSRITLLTQAGQTVETGPLQVIDGENRELAVTVSTLNSGTYLVNWQVLSAVDGHTTTGNFSFGVGVAELSAVSGQSAITARISTLSMAARWLTLTGMSLLMGLFAFRLFIWNPVFAAVQPEPEEEELGRAHLRRSLLVAYGGVAIIGLGLLLTFIDQLNAYDLLQGGQLTTWLNTRFGMIWAMRVILAAAIGVLVWLLPRVTTGVVVWWSGLALSAVFAITASLISHSAALPKDATQGLLVDMGHTIGAGVWAGSLVYFALVVWQARQLTAESRTWLTLSLVINFSGVGAFCVGILMLSGSYLAAQHVGSWTALVGTAYGLALLAKIGLVVLIMLIGAINLLWVKPRLNRAYDQIEEKPTPAILGQFGRILHLEAFVALLILAAAGVLTDLQRGMDAPLLSDGPGQTTVTGTADDLNVTLTFEPALVGNNSFDVYLEDEDGNPIPNASEVTLRYTFLSQSLGAAEGTAVSNNDGHYHLEGSYISLVGPWQIEVAVRRPDAFDTFVPFRVQAGVGGRIRPLEGGGFSLEGAASFLTLLGSLVTGAAMILFAIGWGFLATRAAKSQWQLMPLLAISLVAFWFGSQRLITFYEVEYTPSKFLNNPIIPDATSIAIGEHLYMENCVPCHGPEGRGDGISAASLNPPPINFTAGHTATHADGDLFYWIQNGVDNSAMPAFQDKFTEEEMWHLVNYVRRLTTQ